jgi:hypothetical protein
MRPGLALWKRRQGIRVSLLFSRSLANDKNTVGLIVRTSFISPDHHYLA